jgi:hypothetical protein
MRILGLRSSRKVNLRSGTACAEINEMCPGFMLQNDLLTAVGSLIGISGSILSYIMVRPVLKLCIPLMATLVRGDEPQPDQRPLWRHRTHTRRLRTQNRRLGYKDKRGRGRRHAHRSGECYYHSWVSIPRPGSVREMSLTGGIDTEWPWPRRSLRLPR